MTNTYVGGDAVLTYDSCLVQVKYKNVHILLFCNFKVGFYAYFQAKCLMQKSEIGTVKFRYTTLVSTIYLPT